MKKPGHNNTQTRPARIIPEGDSISKKEKLKLNSASVLSVKTSPKKRQKKKHFTNREPSISLGQRHTPTKQQIPMNETANSSIEHTPESLSQISSILPVDDSAVTFHKVSKSHIKDMTWELAVSKARGEPDGAEGSFFHKKSPKLKRIAEEDEEKSPSRNKENLTVNQPKHCIKVPLKIAGKKIKSLKSKKTPTSGRLSVKVKSKRNFDEPLPNETTVPKKAKMTWKEKRKERKMVKNNYNLIQTAKSVWEEMRRHNIPESRRTELCKNMYSKVQGKIKELAMVHDSARIIQCLVQHGGPEYRTSVLEEIKDNIVELCKSKYAKFIIRKLLKYGSKAQRAVIMKSFHGNIRKLIRHKEASDIVEYAYNDFASSAQRLFMLEEFYGPAFTMFKTHSQQSLDEVLLEQPDKKVMIMHNLKEALMPLIDKQILTFSMVHRIFFDFFKYADEQMRKDMIEALRESLVHLLHTRDGTLVAMVCVWHGSAKDRKTIIKSLKGHILKVCKEDAGHLMLMAIFDVVDDTVLVQKVILDEIIKNLSEVADNTHGRKVLLYLLARRDQAYVSPDVIQLLQHGDNNTTSKKDPAVRAHQLCDYISGPLLKFLKENVKHLISNSVTSLLVPAIIAHASGDASEAMDAVAMVLVQNSDASDSSKNNDEANSMVENPAAHIAIKKLITADRQRIADGLPGLFSITLLQHASASTVKIWAASNRGCFILVNLLEVDNSEVNDLVKMHLVPLKKYLTRMTFKGAEILLQKLEEKSSSPAHSAKPKSKLREIAL